MLWFLSIYLTIGDLSSKGSSVSLKDCVHKCVKNNYYIKYKCVDRDYEYVVQRLDEDSFDSNVELKM